MAKERLMMMGYSEMLVECGQIEIWAEVIAEARKIRGVTPESMVINEWIGEQIMDGTHLADNEYFAERWWELERLDYQEWIHLPLISSHDVLSLKKDQRLLLDLRGSFEEFSQ